jgi:hypothetical protein
MMTQDKKLAIAERKEYDALSAEERKLYADIGDFVHKRRPEISETSASHRSRLLLAGGRADVLWTRVAQGMPLSTAVRLLRDAEKAWRKNSFDFDLDALLGERIARYDGEGTARRVGGGKVVRTQTTAARASRIAKGEARPARRPPARHKTAVREAIAAWVASRLPEGDERAVMMVDDLMREVEVILSSFSARLDRSLPSRAELFEACDLLNVPRPKWGKRVDQKRAWKNRKAALKSTHPDTLGHNGGIEAFQAIKDAYDVIARYNDSIDDRKAPGGQGADAEQEREKGSETDVTETEKA